MAESWILIVMLVIFGSWILIPAGLIAFGARFVRRRLLGKDSSRSTPLLPGRSRKGCPTAERDRLIKMERRLVAVHQQCLDALNNRLPSELARARVELPLEEAYEQIRDEIDSIYDFCERNDLVGTLKKANSSTAARDIYLEAYQRDLAQVQTAIERTEACLTAYERTVATFEVSSVETDINSDFDVAIEALDSLRDELPRYNLEDRV